MGIYDCVFIMMYITNTLHYSTYCLDRLTGDDLSQLGEKEMQSGNLRCRNAVNQQQQDGGTAEDPGLNVLEHDCSFICISQFGRKLIKVFLRSTAD